MRIRNKFIFIIILISLWVAAFQFKIWPPYIFPSPFEVAEKIILLFLGKEKILLNAIALSFKRILWGYSLSFLIGILLGSMMSIDQFLEDSFKMISLGVQSIPSICWVPLAILWFGLSERSILFMIIIGSTFSISMCTYSGIKNIPYIYITAAKSMGARGLKLFFYVILPVVLPDLVIALKQGWSFAWRALIAGEMLSSGAGLGQVLVMSRDMGDISQIFVIMFIIGGTSYIVERCLFFKIEHRIKRKWGLLTNN